jgi:hypothetical protein
MEKPFKQIAIIFFLVMASTSCSATSPSTPLATIPIRQASIDVSPTLATPSDTVTMPFQSTTREVESNPTQEIINISEINIMNIQIGDIKLTATLADNFSTDALIEVLSENPITLEMRDYGNMEKVGPLGMDLPRNDEQITTEAGDIILYQGNALVIYYAPNSWNFTRLGKIDNISSEELKAILGVGNVTITLSLP